MLLGTSFPLSSARGSASLRLHPSPHSPPQLRNTQTTCRGSPDRHLRRHLLGANMNSTFFPTKQNLYIDTFLKAITKWRRCHGFPPMLTHHAPTFITTQWHLHIQHLHKEPRFTARSVKQLQHPLGDTVVLHHADQELQHLRIFCSRLYFRGRMATWHSPELFTPLHHHTVQAYPGTLRRKYRWRLRSKANMPYRHCPFEGQEALEQRPRLSRHPTAHNLHSH